MSVPHPSKHSQESKIGTLDKHKWDSKRALQINKFLFIELLLRILSMNPLKCKPTSPSFFGSEFQVIFFG